MATEVLDQETLDRANARLADKGILKPNGAQQANLTDAERRANAQQGATPPKSRAKRSDAGTKRPVKQAEGKLSKEQIETLLALSGALDEAKIAYLEAEESYTSFLDDITAK